MYLEDRSQAFLDQLARRIVTSSNLSRNTSILTHSMSFFADKVSADCLAVRNVVCPIDENDADTTLLTV